MTKALGCNGFNHAPNCNCGWKGGWKGKFTSDASSSGTFVLNAKCPVCLQPVYYYQNRHGSKVFFDGLGHPWPKHPCTITKDMEIKVASSQGSKVDLSTYDIEKSDLYKNKYSVKFYKNSIPFLFFFTNEILNDAIDIKAYVKGEKIFIRIYLFIEKYKQSCLLEGEGYKTHPAQSKLKRLKLIKLGSNNIAYEPIVKNKSKKGTPEMTRCTICNSRVSKKNLQRHIRKAHQ